MWANYEGIPKWKENVSDERENVALTGFIKKLKT